MSEGRGADIAERYRRATREERAVIMRNCSCDIAAFFGYICREEAESLRWAIRARNTSDSAAYAQAVYVHNALGREGDPIVPAPRAERHAFSLARGKRIREHKRWPF